MKKIKYHIVSYKRPQCITIKTLLDLGVGENDICIFLQNEEDLIEYGKTWPNIKKHMEISKGLNANRNNALRMCDDGDWVLLFDDDIISFSYLTPISEEKIRTRKIFDKRIFNNIITSTFEECERIQCPMWGISPTSNAVFAKSRLLGDGEYSINRLFQGGLIGHIKNDIYYDESYELMTDYELQLRYYKSGNIILRRNDIAANKKPNGNYSGGLFETYRVPNKRKHAMERLVAEYGNLIEIKPDWSGLKQKV